MTVHISGAKYFLGALGPYKNLSEGASTSSVAVSNMLPYWWYVLSKYKYVDSSIFYILNTF